MKTLFRPAFELFRRASSTVNYCLVILWALIAQSAALALYFIVAPAGYAGTASGSLLAVALIGVGMFIVGLYLYAVMAVIGKYSILSLSRMLERFASGDLSLQFLPGWGDKSEAQTVWTALNQMNREFPNIIRAILSIAQDISGGSREIALGYDDLSRRTSEQASILEEVAASVEELSATVKKNADYCQQANQSVGEVGGRAEEAAQSMRQVTDTMDRIQDSTTRMRNSVSLIEGIAFQTNILALNAAVEAARAGEQGHGFAVVAAEVRALAQRSAGAAAEIKALIKTSATNVDEGAALVSQAEQTVDRAVAGIHRVVEIVNDVAAGSTEQAAGIQAIGKALTQLEEITQRNASLVEEGAAAAASFDQEAAQLVHAVDVFRLEDETSVHGITVGNRRTAIKNYALGPVATAFVLPALTLLVKTRNAVKMTFTAIPFFMGSLVTLFAAFAAMRANATVSSSFAAVALPIVVIGALLIGIYLFVALSTWGQLGTSSLQRLSHRLASGDLSWTVRADTTVGKGERRRESSIVNMALVKILKHFTNVVRQVRASAERVVTGSREIAAGYTDLSQRTEDQSSTIEETAASVEELSATAKQNANNCQEANSVGRKVRGRAEEAAQAMQRVKNTMTRIEDSSKRMAEFIRLIEDIAFQTNILALNAAVEAARAGDQGRGFAVVAAEVRALAQRSAKATEDIKALIADSANHVNEGVTFVSQAEQAVSESAAGIGDIAEVISSIATASTEQNEGMRQIGKALIQLENATQQNAALVEEGAAAAVSFERQADRLVQMVSVFRLEQEGKEPSPGIGSGFTSQATTSTHAEGTEPLHEVSRTAIR